MEFFNRFKNGVEFEPFVPKYNVEYHKNGMVRFEIRNVDASDLGEYRCHATNIHGYDNSTAKLSFECKKSFMVSSIFQETHYRTMLRLDPTIRPITFAISAIGVLVSIMLMMNACGSPEFQCDNNLDSIREFIFQCMSSQCNLNPH